MKSKCVLYVEMDEIFIFSQHFNTGQYGDLLKMKNSKIGFQVGQNDTQRQNFKTFGGFGNCTNTQTDKIHVL